MKYSERLGSIPDKQFQKALDKFDLGRFIKAEAVPFGIFGQNVFITSTKGKFVLRGKPHYNMTVDKVDDNWVVTGIFDLMETYFGHQEADLSRTFIEYKQEDEELAYIFLNSYFKNASLESGFSERFPIFIVFDRSIIWEWAQRNGKMWWQENLTFREWCEPFCDIRTDRLIIS